MFVEGGGYPAVESRIAGPVAGKAVSWTGRRDNGGWVKMNRNMKTPSVERTTRDCLSRVSMWTQATVSI